SPVPVLLAGPAVGHAGATVRQVVACLDGSERAERALDTAAGLAPRLGADLVLLRGFGEADVVDRAGLDDLPATAARGPGVRQLATLQGADVAAAIAEYAGDQGDTILTLGTRGRTAVGRAVLGSVARRTTQLAACPVLAVPPTAGRALVAAQAPTA